MKAICKALLPSLLILAPVASMAADRLLAQGPGYSVIHNYAETCGQVSAITIRSQDYDFFTDDPPELQHILDAARAMLEYQCGEVEAIGVTGELTGLRGPMYTATARRSDDWMLVADRLVRETRATEYKTEGSPSFLTEDMPNYTVANLATGMSVQQAEQAMRDTFGSAPRYDAEQGLMTLQLNGCPADFDKSSRNPGSDWKCVKAWFSDQRVPTLERLQLVQVVGDTNLDALETALLERFGTPHTRHAPGGDNWWTDGMETVQMLWGEESSADTNTQQLEATLTRRDEMIVTIIELDDPGQVNSRVASERALTGFVF